VPQDPKDAAPYPPQDRPGAIGLIRTTHERPDGTTETRSRWIYGREKPTASAPSCDAPHCDCATGEDCRANVAASGPTMSELNAQLAAMKAHVPLWTLSWDGKRFHVTDGIVHGDSDVLKVPFTVRDVVEVINRLVRGMRLSVAQMTKIDALSDGPTVYTWKLTHRDDILVLTDGWQVVEYRLPESVSYDDMREGLHVLIDRLHSGKATARDPLRGPISQPLATMSGIQSTLDALVKRLPETDAHMIRVVMPAEVHREGDVETWILNPAFQGHDAPFSMGDALTDSSAYHGIFQVLSVGQRFVDKKISLRVKRHPGFVFDTEAF
jgi:hypothetical protein